MFSSTSYKATDIALSIFLVIWFGLGNYWVFKIYPPNFETSLWQPNNWLALLRVYNVLKCAKHTHTRTHKEAFVIISFTFRSFAIQKLNFEIPLLGRCSKTLYIFAVAQLLFVHVVLGCFFLLCFCLCCGQKCVEVFGDSYK